MTTFSAILDGNEVSVQAGQTILELCEGRGIEVRLALRSRFAPQFVAEARPDLVLAVACEHELVAGILRVAPYRCFEIMNRRPEGMCQNTLVPLGELNQAIEDFIACAEVGARPRQGGG